MASLTLSAPNWEWVMAESTASNLTAKVPAGARCSSQWMARTPSYRASGVGAGKRVRGHRTRLASRDQRHAR